MTSPSNSSSWFVMAVAPWKLSLAPLGRSLVRYSGVPATHVATEAKSHQRRFMAQQDLDRLKIESYMPVQREVMVKRGKRTYHDKPLLGCYVFVRFDLVNDPWQRVYDYDWCYGLLNWAGTDRPRPISDAVIEGLRRAEDVGAFGGRTLRAGEIVEVAEGPFAGLIGKVLRTKAHKRARILLGALGVVDIDPVSLKREPEIR